MKKRKPDPRGSKKGTRAFQIKKISLILAISAGLLFFILAVVLALRNLDYFKVKEIIINENSILEGKSSPGIILETNHNIDLEYLKKKNIFSLDLQKESRYISELYPSYKNVRMIKVFPNRLFVDFLRRQPLAYLRLSRYFCVGEDLVLFEMPKELEEPDLPVICGLENKIYGPKSGKRYPVKELWLGVYISKEIKLAKGMAQYKIKKIDVANPDSAAFFLAVPPEVQDAEKAKPVVTNPLYLEIKIGQEAVRLKLKILSGLLAQLKKPLAEIDYIDLRFKEPVIKLRDTKIKRNN